MEKLLKQMFIPLTLGLTLSTPVSAQSNIIADVNNPVIGLIGASYVDPEAAYGNTVGLTALNGSSYRGINDFLIGETINDPTGLVFREKAEGGATTDGANGFNSMLGQAQELYEHTTMWGDGSHLKAAVLFQFNDCKHTIAGLCPTMEDVLAGPIQNTLQTIAYLQQNDVKVFVIKMPAYEDLDLVLTEEIFSQVTPGFAAASEEQYRLLQQAYEQHVYTAEGVVLIDAWNKFKHMGDGLHPDYKTRKKAAKTIVKSLKKALNKDSN
ncbi:hypothetical protein [Catenovulum agarivorans]|uniref:hypothetical protein n=1 Tax=Catenovulum agarivorans TaxID=1172192 RepID=UPI00030B93E9|nr:hypothetical protein [Catenovulum agarivorans]